ncbi:MAG: SOS response-associated peptidase [Ardenticatenaceae bacterium]|nr:SOS response-associated peptidase [Ardenticatenaceae bacterium]MCB8972160.1 SOS response-associated peptidase [Ardenticatenaceae bacterium]
MCGRFALMTPTEQLALLFDLPETAVAALPPSVPRYNIAPTQPVAAIRLDTNGQRDFTFFHWGLIPSWSKDPTIGSRMINARSETVTEKPSFRTAFKRRRCLIPADGFYEWQKLGSGKQPMFIRPAGEERPFALAGLWELWSDPDGGTLQSCTILTTSPNELMAPIHNRMPVIIEPEDFDLWLNPEPDPEQGLHLLRPYPAEKMAAYPVSTVVNNPRNDMPDCIQPIA